MTGRAVVLGGGAAGFFAAIRAAEQAPGAHVVLMEAARAPLQKVKISGGGRCNLTHNLFDAGQLVTRYPRGAKELRGVLSRFGPRDTMAWFEAHGVTLKVERDGRVFPTSDDSQTILDALERAAADAGVEVRTSTTLAEATATPGGFHLHLRGGETLHADALVLATGSNPHGLALAKGFGHTVIPGVPSLFTFEVSDPRLDGLAGVAVEHVRARLTTPDGAKFEQEGPLLVTHWGLSAHSVLRLSAWAAREMHASGYRGSLSVDWLPGTKDDELRRRCEDMRVNNPRGTLGAHAIAPELPRRLWERLVEHAGGDLQMRWAEVPKRGVHALVEELKRGTFEVNGKGPFKEEFVTAGGVARSEVDWRTMESRRVPGLFFAGEVLDVDALTGGFNLQNAWSTGWLAGTAVGERLASVRPSDARTTRH